MKNLMIAALMLLSSQAFASDAYVYQNLGFSADGRYYAFIQHVIQDGSGVPDAKGQVIDVAQNRTVEIESVILEDENATLKQAIDQVKARLHLNRYGIDGKNPGQTLWMRFPTDLTQPTKQANFSLDYGVDGGASTVWPKFNLNVTEIPVTGAEECYSEVSMIKVSLAKGEETWSRDLQTDSRLPKSRGCSYAYQIRQVLKFGGSIAAVLRYQSTGFEGPDYIHMVVTAAEVLQ